jgi:hypothetical protein
LEEGADAVIGGEKGCDLVSAESSGDRSQDHVDFSSGGKDQGHVDLSIDGAEDAAGGDKDENHVDLSVDPDGAHTVEADLMPGTGGAEIRGFDGSAESLHVDFRITISPDGRIEVNGQELAACDPAKGCRISLSWCPGTGALVVQAEDASGAVCAAQYAMEGAPEGVCISAAEVRALSVLRQ